MEFIALVIAVIALVRVSQIERQLRQLRQLAPPRAQTPRTPRPEAGPPAAPGSPDAPPVSPPPFTPRVAEETAAAGEPSAVRAPPAALPSMRPPAASAPRAAPPSMRPPVPPDHPPAPPGPLFGSFSRPSAERSASERIERSIGERYLLYAGMVVLVLAVASFLRYAFEQQWLSPLVRVVLGAAAGVALAATGRLLASAGYRQYGLFLSGGGLVMLFLSVYAAFAFYALIGQAPAFALLAAVAAGAAALAGSESSLPLALLAIIGGFATPFLVGGETDAQLTLFSYVAALIAAAAYLAHRRQWPWLSVVTLVLTVLTLVAWADAHYTDAVYLRTELFLTLYCAMFLVMQRISTRSQVLPDQVASGALWAAPALYHAASVGILSPHVLPYLVYLVLVSGAAIAGSVAGRTGALRLVGWVLVIVPLLVWATTSEGQSWPAGTALAAIGIWIMFAVAIVWVTRRPGTAPHEPFSMTDVAVIHGNGPGLFAVLYILLADDWRPLSLATAGAMLAAVHAGIWTMTRMTPGALHWLGVAATLGAVAVAVGFEGRWTVILWAAEAAVMVWIGARLRSMWFRTAGLALFGIAAAGWLVDRPDVRTLVVPLLNAHALAGAFTVAMLYVAAWVLRGLRAEEDSTSRAQQTIALIGASLLTVLLVSREITSFWYARRGGALDADLAMHLMLSACWAGYAAILIAAGMRYRYVPIRYFAIGLLGLTLVKVFAVDVWQLEGVYRVVGLLAVGTILLVASFFYQRGRTNR